MEVLVKYKWIDHGQNVISQLANFWKQELFTDCTILCRGKKFQVHRLILASCSEYFKEVFDNAQCCHPIIIMNDISSENLQIILNYIYQVNFVIPQKKLLVITEEGRALKIKGFEDSSQLLPNSSSNDFIKNFRLLQKSLSPVVSITKLDDVHSDISLKRKVPKEWDSEKKVRNVDDSAYNVKVKVTKNLIQDEDTLLTPSSETCGLENIFHAPDDKAPFIGFDTRMKQEYQKQDEVLLDEKIIKKEEEILAFPLEESIPHDTSASISQSTVEHFSSSETVKQFDEDMENNRLAPETQNPFPEAEEADLQQGGKKSNVEYSKGNTIQENSNQDEDEVPGKEGKSSKTSHQVHSENEGEEMLSQLEELTYEGSQSSLPAEEEAHFPHRRLESVEEHPKGCLKYMKPKRLCPFCQKRQSQLTRHIKLAHRKELEVQQILTLSPSQQMIQFERLRKRGINEENKKRLIMNSQQDVIQPLMTQRGERSKLIRKCPICQGFYSATYVRYHIKKCQVKFGKPSKCFKPLKISPKYGAVSLIDDISEIEFLPSFVKNVLESFLDDEIGNECRSNPLIKYVGYSLYLSRAEPEDDKEKQKIQVIKKGVASKMRLLCRLYLNFVKQVGRKINLDEMFYRGNLDSFKRAVKEISKSNSHSRHILGHFIMNTARILQQRLRDVKKESEASEIENFSKGLENPVNWVPLFGSQRIYASVKSAFEMKKPSNLPQLSDLSKLVHFLISQVISLSKKPFTPMNYALLRATVLTRLTFLNACRGGDPCRLLMKHWVEAKNDAWLNEDFLSVALTSNEEDKELLAQFKICFEKGKGPKSVSLMIPNDLITAMDILCDPIIRERSGINSENQYVFATRGSNCYHAQGVSDIHHVMKLCNVTGIKAREMKHFMSTKQALMNRFGHARALFYLHMGHEKIVNIKNYQSELIKRISKVGKILKTVDEYLQLGNTIQENSNQDEDEVPGKEGESSKTSHQVHSENEGEEMLSELEELTYEENTIQGNFNQNEDEIQDKEGKSSKTSHQVHSENEGEEMLSQLELAHEERKEIMSFIRENPGIFLNRNPRTRKEVTRRKVIGLRQTNRRDKSLLYKHL